MLAGPAVSRVFSGAVIGNQSAAIPHSSQYRRAPRCERVASERHDTMTRHERNEAVKSGYYFNPTTLSVSLVASDGARLPSGKGAWLAVPAPLALALAPVLGALFLMFLPVIGFVMCADAAGRNLAAVFSGGAGELAATLSPAWVPGEAHLAGSPAPAGHGRDDVDHLETNHRLLTPLYRTSRRTRTEIKGSEISDYLKKFFSTRFRRHRITFSTDNAFNDYVFYTFESVVKPAFINVINNALYWLLPASKRQIEIRMKDGKILILNSGAKIDDVYLEDIFTLFFTRRPGGRGIGLYLAKTNLHTIGFEIYATNDRAFNKLGGACFVIEPCKETDNEL